MKKMAKDTGLEIDEELKVDLGISKERESNSAAEDRKIEEAVKKARVELKSLLNEPIVEAGSAKKELEAPGGTTSFRATEEKADALEHAYFQLESALKTANAAKTQALEALKTYM